MANPITPSGFRRRLVPEALYSFQNEDIAESARRQDAERRIREDNQYFERTGVNRPPVQEYSPLVDNDRPDIANDGDSYDESRQYNFSAIGEYVEDNPTRLIEPNQQNILRNRSSRIRACNEERDAYIDREQIKQEKEFQEKSEKQKKRFKNAISGLGVNEE